MRLLLNAATARLGGAITFLQHVVPALAERTELVLLLPDGDVELGTDDVVIESHGHAAGSIRLRLDVDNLLVNRVARRHSVDAVLSATNHGPFRCVVPHVLMARNILYFRGQQDLVTRTNALLALAAMNRAASVVFPTRAMLRAAMDRGFRGHGTVLPHPVPVPTRSWRPRPTDGVLRILVPGSLAPHKNIKLLPSVARALRELGIEAEISVTAVEGEAAQVPNPLKTVPRYVVDRIGDVAAEFDAVLLPSLAESFNYQLVEFQAIGIPVVASDLAAHRELRTHAVLFDPSSAHACAAAVCEAVTGPPPVVDAREHEALFGLPRYVDGLLRMIEQVAL